MLGLSLAVRLPLQGDAAAKFSTAAMLAASPARTIG
jgi:hypothetical protein